jgi:hypothetical protein
VAKRVGCQVERVGRVGPQRRWLEVLWRRGQRHTFGDVDQPLPLQHCPGGARTVGVEHAKPQVIRADPGVVERLRLVAGKVEQCPDLLGVAAVGWVGGAGEHRAGVRVGDRPGLDGGAGPGPPAGRGGLGGREPVGFGQFQDATAGDAEQAGGLGGGDELGVAGRGHGALPGEVLCKVR